MGNQGRAGRRLAGWWVFAAVLLIVLAGTFIWLGRPPAPVRDAQVEWCYTRASYKGMVPRPDDAGLLVYGGDGVEILDAGGNVTTRIKPPGKFIWNATVDMVVPVCYLGGQPGLAAAYTFGGLPRWTRDYSRAKYTMVAAVPGGGVVTASVYEIGEARETRLEWLDSTGGLLGEQVLDFRSVVFSQLPVDNAGAAYLYGFEGDELILTAVAPDTGVAWEYRTTLEEKYSRSLKPNVTLDLLPDGVLVASVQGTGVRAINADGTPAWSRETPELSLVNADSWCSFCPDGRGGGYVLRNELITAVNADGTERWSRDTGVLLQQPVVSGDAILATGLAIPPELINPGLGWFSLARLSPGRLDQGFYVVELDDTGRLRCFWRVPEGFILSHGTDRADTCYGWAMTGTARTEVIKLYLPR